MNASIRACLSCEGRCCSAYRVPLTGDDVWRIVQAQRLAPALFVQREPEDYPSATGFRLRPNGPTWAILLRHQYDRRNERPCIFLMHLRAGVARCGIYPHRPLACQTYPMRFHPDGVAPRDDMLCPPGSWIGVAEQPGEWRERLARQDVEWDRYAGVVQVWNTAVDRLSAEHGLVLDEYLAYLIAAYDALRTSIMSPSNLSALADAWAEASASS